MRLLAFTPSGVRPARPRGARLLISAVACGALLTAATGCGGSDGPVKPSGPAKPSAPAHNGNPAAAGSAHPVNGPGIPGLGERTGARIPSGTRQLVVVYGEDRDSADSLAVLYEKHGATWDRTAAWPAHNGRRGWTTDHQLDDERSPAGVFTLTDAGGSLRSPGTKLPYWYDDHAFAASLKQGDEAHAHDFDYVIAIDYNHVKGTPPFDWNRPEGVEKGGGIWLHIDHGDGTSACVTVPEPAMKTLLHTLDPAQHPAVVMGDRERLMR